jgi:hypothetical protein
MIKLKDKNETYIQLDVDNEDDFFQVMDFFTVKIPGAEFMPSVKMGLSSGTQKFITPLGEIPYGLKKKLINFCESNNIEVHDDTSTLESEISYDQFCRFVDMLDLPFEPYPHQIRGAYKGISNYRNILLSATGSGKSLLIFIILRYMLLKKYKSMLIVPTIDLVNQMYTDFEEYFSIKFNKIKEEMLNTKDEIQKESLKNDLEQIIKRRKVTNCVSIEESFARIFGGQDKHTEHICKISTYQSLSIAQDRVDPEYFIDVNALIVDECLDPKTKITMADGTVKNIENIEIGDKVLTINESTNLKEVDEVVKVHKNINLNQMFEITMEDNSIIKITGNHKVSTLNGWKRVDTLSLDDEIIDLNVIEIVSKL